MTAIETATLTRVGEGLALVFEESTLKLLGIDAQTRLNIQTVGRSLVISPLETAADPITDEEFKAAVDTVMTRYEATFRKLAE